MHKWSFSLLILVGLAIVYCLSVVVCQNVGVVFNSEFIIDPRISTSNISNISNDDACKVNKKCWSGLQEAMNYFQGSLERAEYIESLKNSSSIPLFNLTFSILSDDVNFCGFNLVSDEVSSIVIVNIKGHGDGHVKLTCPGSISFPNYVQLISFENCHIGKVKYQLDNANVSVEFRNTALESLDLNLIGKELKVTESTVVDGKLFFSGDHVKVSNSEFTQSVLYLNDGNNVEISNIIERTDSVFAIRNFSHVQVDRIEFNRDYGKLYVYNFISLSLTNSIFNSKMLRRPAIYLFNGLECRISNIKINSVSQFMAIGSVKELLITNIEITNCQVTTFCIYRTPISILDCQNVVIRDSIFEDNEGSIYGGAIYLTNYFHVTLSNNSFKRNKAHYGGAVNFGFCFADLGFSCSIIIIGNTFENNLSSIFGGAIYILYSEYLTLRNNTFIRNNATQSAGAVMIDYAAHIRLENSIFKENFVLKDGSNHGFSLVDGDISISVLYGGGGSVTIRSFYSIDAIQNEFVNNYASRGSSLLIGKVNLDDTPNYVKIKNTSFVENVGVQGRCAHFVKLPPNVLLDIESSSPDQEFSSSPSSFSLSEFGPSVIYFGKEITVKINAVNYFGQEMNLRKQTFVFKRQDEIYLKFGFNQEDDVIITPYSKSKTLKISQTVITLYSEDGQYSFNLTVSLSECPYHTSMDTIVVDTLALYGCVKNSIELETVLGASIPLAIILILFGIFVGILSLYLIRFISLQMWTLKKKQKAEMNLEMKIIDKKIIFSEQSNDERLNSSSTVSTTNRSKGSNKSELASPLIEMSECPSFIIPIEHVDIIKRVAEGGLGIIYLGKLWKKIDVAIKLLKSTDNSDEFESEVSLLSALRHDNILTFYGICLSGDNKYMITEFAEMGSLDKALYRARIGETKMSLYKKLSILVATAKGIEYLHNLNPIVVHRDLKPGNILLDSKNIAKICDFGLSRTVSNSSMQSVMTTNLGTLFYCPSEVLEGPNESNMASKQTATKIDVYSFAIIMWEIFFEMIPYSFGVKLTPLYREVSLQEEQARANLNLFNIPGMVSKGMRPLIPFKSDEEVMEWIDEYMPEERGRRGISEIVLKYFEIVKRNWTQNATHRDTMGTIRAELEELLIRLEK